MSQTTSDQDFWREVPSVEAEPAPGAQPWAGFAGADRPRLLLTRRVTLQALGALGGALALNVLSWLPPFKAAPARAAVGTEYLHCAGYSDSPGYDNNTIVCYGAPYSRDYCGNDGWFLQWSGTCFVSAAVKACGAGAYGGTNKRNAWRWTHNQVPYRCADGRNYFCDGSSVFRICSWSYP